MAFTHKIIETWTSGNRSIATESDYSGDAQESKDVSIPDSETDYLVNFALDVSQIQAIFILSDQDITLETNDGGSPVDTISLLAGKPYIWKKTDSYDTCKLTTDITALYITNTGNSAAARLQIEVVKDDTP